MVSTAVWPVDLLMHFGTVPGKHRGAKAKVAALLGVHHSTVTKWMNPPGVPLEQQERLEFLTNGALRADSEHFRG